MGDGDIHAGQRLPRGVPMAAAMARRDRQDASSGWDRRTDRVAFNLERPPRCGGSCRSRQAQAAGEEGGAGTLPSRGGRHDEMRQIRHARRAGLDSPVRHSPEWGRPHHFGDSAQPHTPPAQTGRDRAKRPCEPAKPPKKPVFPESETVSARMSPRGIGNRHGYRLLDMHTACQTTAHPVGDRPMALPGWISDAISGSCLSCPGSPFPGQVPDGQFVA